MIEFKILKNSKKSWARLGILKTEHGVVETPCLVPVATQAVVKTLDSREVKETKTQILIANTFHLHLKPGEKIIEAAGGLHKFMNWQGSLMTDSGGFQVFSLGFGKDFNVGKILKYFPGQNTEIIKKSRQPKFLKITQDGVYFQSPLDGRKLFLGPKKAIKIQEQLGADIIFAFDECTAPLTSFEYAKKSLERTHKWAKICLENKRSKQAIFGIVQGSRFKELRQESAKFINSLGFDGFGIGGDLGQSKKTMKKILNWTIPYLEKSKPRHLLGIGYLEDIENIIKSGIDLFDCTVPTHYGRRGVAFTGLGDLKLQQAKFLRNKNPIDRNCKCFVCQNYTRGYISHLIRAKEITGMKLVTFHNLYFFNTFVEEIRKKIKEGKI
ncbi:MAG: tRNA guanosine(34) transglycosylase Tgt [Candidatus Nealsonbacteria bacterium CG08_land_8_20_14_0_20_36_22]|uniref:Queuine tRNA-ribosyltransferase n=2 Tax=Candidatus Nealsoniibacteriota TaxID=1817911 RepID=A0A2H0YPY9_9BACT|nr:MAG: tRNA guanosine(34) transglycosylase Tgt [Candidatus Nealsonbacteria bacterium CG08_land_8_20_14_0_20_36_22]